MHAEPKPWAVLDDDADIAPQAGAARSSAAASPSAEPWTRSPVLRMIEICRERLDIDSRWAACPIGLGAAWLCFASVWSDPTIGLTRGAEMLNAAVVAMLSAAGIALLLLSRRSGRNDGERLHDEQRRALAQRLGLGDASDARLLWSNIEQHAANIEHRVQELVDEQRRLQLEASLAAVQKRSSEAILNAIAEPLLVVDRFDNVLFINRAAAEVFNTAEKSEARRSLDQVVSDPRLISAVRQAREAESRAAKRRAELDFADRAFALSMTALPEAGADPTQPGAESSHGIVVLFRDVTRERLAAKAKSEFVAHVSHELRTPLSSIRAYTEMLVDGEAADEKTRAEYYGIIQTSADRLGRLIDNMLNISRIEAGTVRINREPVAVSIIVKEVADSLKPQADEKQIALITDLAPVVDRVMADRDLLHQAVLNLVSNAIKYTPEGGNVTVRMMTQDEQNTMRIEVVDTGVGIPPEDLPHMFEKFYRVEANKKMAKGTGLGLNLVKNIVEVVHEGKLSLKSEVGKGSTFAITLAKVI